MNPAVMYIALRSAYEAQNQANEEEETQPAVSPRIEFINDPVFTHEFVFDEPVSGTDVLKAVEQFIQNLQQSTSHAECKIKRIVRRNNGIMEAIGASFGENDPTSGFLVHAYAKDLIYADSYYRSAKLTSVQWPYAQQLTRAEIRLSLLRLMPDLQQCFDDMAEAAKREESALKQRRRRFKWFKR